MPAAARTVETGRNTIMMSRLARVSRVRNNRAVWIDRVLSPRI
ncbi:hypothetical protein L518_0305 [Bordetella bronchiseptica MBORD675]|nr:hypothetical protein L507_0558 [Bordetella bronchiseptica CA90 BB02]KCV45584.1 hypothetical protein L572_0662 [Bordetella bronchiseptica 345]KCV55674.1 hypothetical protein L492_0615 [Bordetella bronchiseptica 7E71]KDC28499.1 hypothetical protein L505_0643 [Bordetella bronchiseptica F4563]KDC38596.1 hypothetical protein L506_0608 [Bordetella bronchiseptica GA96-01]KDC99427.1 hypothetical protein L518_0305 [Bordetella bronchiseptica MBORD675]KDD42511.1 hypothetical protein L529_0609 [Bordet